VLIEIADGLARLRYRHLAIELHDRLMTAAQITVVQTNPVDEAEAWELYRRRDDKEWGMTDCVSIVVMRRIGITTVFSSDRDFAQAGLNLLIHH
jgi:predicted nucleic acid-binding protein